MAERRPRIGIVGLERECVTVLGSSPHITCRLQFIERLVAAGCLPIIVPPKTASPVEYLDVLDGVIFPGGGDVDPRLYGEEPHPETNWVDPERDQWEYDFARSILMAERPVLGICRGLQLLNVALGGTLHQHLPERVDLSLPHCTVDNAHAPTHTVHVHSRSHLARALGIKEDGNEDMSIGVNSIHHQGVARLGNNLTVTAIAEDGLVEAVEMKDHHFVLAVQWHPELQDDPRQLGLFDALVAAARGRLSQLPGNPGGAPPC